MQHSRFVHLHNHTGYSLLDGACRIVDEKGRPADLLKTIESYKMPALAITDHGNMYGAIEFYKACVSVGIKPIIGCECYLAPQSRFDRTGGMSETAYHITILAKNSTGYKNLMKLSSMGFIEGFYYKPRIDKDILKTHSEGLIALSGCLKGEIPKYVLKSDMTNAEKAVESYLDIFGEGNFYIEAMNHLIPEQIQILPGLERLSKKMKVPLVATNDCHYLHKADAEVQDALMCIGTGKLISDEKRLKFSTQEFYYKSPEEMIALFKDMPEAVTSTLEITEKCNLDISFDNLHLPHYPIPEGETADTYLDKLCREGVIKRYGQMTPELKSRLDHELTIIKKMGFSSYFLIVWDFIQFARSHEIPVGPGRGSGAGSLVAYVLEITSICPLKYGLLFERFLNPDRRSMPDLDIDFSDEGREKVIEYVKTKYGQNSVAQIITFGSLMARSVVRDVGRVMDIPLQDVDKIAKMIPRDPGTTLHHALRTVPELKKQCDLYPQIKKLIEYAQKLEGLKRHTGVHAAGTVIGKDNITSFTPLARGSKDIVTTQYDGDTLTKMGMLKIDFLGLRTLTVMSDAQKAIKKFKNKEFALGDIPFDDKKTYKLLSKAQTIGVFQLESSGMRDLLRKLKPTNMNDIIALISLFRPGPIGSGMLDDFVARRHGKVKVTYDHPALKPVLQETYGVIVYQEQVMKIATSLTGFSSGKADDLRKAMGKKIPEVMEKYREEFITGASERNIPKQLATTIFDKMAHFGGYGFNKSHASAYGVLAYQTAYLKANYPIEFMTALLTSEIGRSAVDKGEGSKLVQVISEIKNMNIELLPPDVQKSFHDFTIEHDKGVEKIRYGLLAVKNVGSGAVDSIIEQRANGSFASMNDFLMRVDNRTVNRKVIESLIKAGAFDGFGEDAKLLRAEFSETIDEMLTRSSKAQEDKLYGQGSLFNLTEMNVPGNGSKGSRPQLQPWPEHTLLSNEREVLGFYLSGHPLTKFQQDLKIFSSVSISEIQDHFNREPQKTIVLPGKIYLAGMVTCLRQLISKGKKQAYARFKLESLDGEIDVLVFPTVYTAEVAKKLIPNEMMVVAGKLNGSEEAQELLADELLTFMEARDKLVQKVIVSVTSAGLEDSMLKKIKQVLIKHPGNSTAYIQINTRSRQRVLIETGLKVKASSELKEAVEKLLGTSSLDIQRVS
ncbi:MAG: DNA polymerase III subunit alpha [bacterium]